MKGQASAMNGEPSRTLGIDRVDRIFVHFLCQRHFSRNSTFTFLKLCFLLRTKKTRQITSLMNVPEALQSTRVFFQSLFKARHNFSKSKPKFVNSPFCNSDNTQNSISQHWQQRQNKTPIVISANYSRQFVANSGKTRFSGFFQIAKTKVNFMRWILKPMAIFFKLAKLIFRQNSDPFISPLLPSTNQIAVSLDQSDSDPWSDLVTWLGEDEMEIKKYLYCST